MIVTDKEYSIDNKLLEKLDLAIKRYDYKKDNLFIIDGEEGSGKTTAAVGFGYYIAHKMNIPFSVDNVFFDLDELLKFAASNVGQVIIWDEAALGGMAMDWRNRTQQKLIKVLMTCRKKKHFYFFIIPKFWKLNEYIVDRAIGLIHIYSPDLIQQGFFTYFKKTQKDLLYERMKDRKFKSYKIGWSLRGRFVKKGFVIDQDAYEIKKDKAIMDLFKEKEEVVGQQKNRFYRSIEVLQEKTNLTAKELAKELKVNPMTIYRANAYNRRPQETKYTN